MSGLVRETGAPVVFHFERVAADAVLSGAVQ